MLITSEKNFSDWKNVSSISSEFFVCKIGEKLSRFSNLKKKKLPKKPQIQSCITHFFTQNESKATQFWKYTAYLFFRNPFLPQISTFSSGQKGCAYYEKSAYYEWAQYLFVTNQEKGIYIEILFILKIAFALFKLEKFKKRLRLCLWFYSYPF